MPRVHVIGPVSWNLLVHVPRLPEPRPHTVFAERHHETLGGTSAGKALNLRRLGLDVTLSTLLGDDAAGERVLRELRSAGVQVLARRSVNGTERHANLMDAQGRRLSVYLTLPEAAPDVTGECAERRRAAVATADVVVADLSDHSRDALAEARAAGKEVWCDLHDYDGSSAFHEEFLAAADVLFLSEERLADPEAFVRAQVQAGKRLVVCTQGARGALAMERGGELVHVPAAEIAEVVDTNGAGDAFFAGFLAASLTGADLRECLERATRSAAACLGSWELAGAPLEATGESRGLVPA